MVRAGLWWACCRGGGQGDATRWSVVSVMADRALASSTRVLSWARAAMRAAMARLLTLRGLPRLLVWMRVIASSVKIGSVRFPRFFGDLVLV